jgi:hypothetical protein
VRAEYAYDSLTLREIAGDDKGKLAWPLAGGLTMADTSFRQAGVGGGVSPDTPSGKGAPAARATHAAEWGLASLLLGGVLAVLALLTVIFDVLYKANLSQIRPGRGDVMVTIVFCGILTLLLTFLALANVILGFVGLRSAVAGGQPAGLPLAALMLGGVVALLWVAVFVGMVMEAADLMRRF